MGGGGEDSRKETVKKREREKMLFIGLHPRTIILEQEGLRVTSNDRPRSGTSYLLVGLSCSLGKEGEER